LKTLDLHPRMAFKVRVRLIRDARIVADLLMPFDPDMRIGDFKDQIAKLCSSFPKHHQRLVYSAKVLTNTASMKDYDIQDGSRLFVVYTDRLNEKDFYSPPPKTIPRASEPTPTPIPMNATFEPIIQYMVSLGFDRAYVASEFQKNFGNADVSAGFQMPSAPFEVSLAGEDGWTRVAIADGKVEVLGFFADFEASAQVVSPARCLPDAAFVDDFVWVAPSFDASEERPTSKTMMDKPKKLIEEERYEEVAEKEAFDISQIPENFLCELMADIMSDPVMLPQSKKVVERSTACKVIAETNRDPYANTEVTLDMLIPQPELKEQIHRFAKDNGISLEGGNMFG